MKRSTAVCFILIALLVSCEQGMDRYRISPEIMVEKPISPLLYSNFIELGYGIQVEPMWGEMLFNRSFESFTPYKDNTKRWFDLYIDDTRTKYKTDWSGEDWYHSGYEHNPWFAAPGFGGVLPIDDSSTFFINTNPDSPVILHQNRGGIHGDQYLKIENPGNEWGGLAQEGKFVKAGETYIFTGYFKAYISPLDIELRIYPEGSWVKPIQQIPLRISNSSGFEKVETRFTNSDYVGRITLAIWIPPGSQLDVDALSFMPENTINGWRPEAIASTKQVKPGVIRFPGGCFASFYNWHDGIGPKDSRKPQPSYFWGGFNYNDVGVAELVRFAQAANAEMMYCVNVFHPSKREWANRNDDGTGGKIGYEFPEFTDLDSGSREAANLVAYCNLPVGAHPMADLRASHGHPEPFGIKYWEMDNEVARWFSHDDYARAVVKYARAMKEVDPTIKIGMVTYGGRMGKPRFSEKLVEMLEICGEQVDFLADRGEIGPHLDEMLKKLKHYESQTGHYIAYCDTEKLFYEKKEFIPEELQDDYDWEDRFSMFGTWVYAMNVIKNFMAYQRKGGDVLFVNFNNLANTHNQCAFNTPKEGAFLSASGVVMELLSRSPAAWPLVIENYESTLIDEFQVQAALSMNKKDLVLYVFNRTKRNRNVRFNLSGLNRSFSIMETDRLSAEGLLVINTQKNPDAIRTDSWKQEGLKIIDIVDVKALPYSFTQVVLR